MLKNAMCLISTSLKTLQVPFTGVCSSRFNIFSRPSGFVLQMSIQIPTSSSLVTAPILAINRFGRIGKNVLRLALEDNLNVVAINEPSANIEDIRNSLKFDTVHGPFSEPVIIRNKNNLEIDGKNNINDCRNKIYVC